MRNERASKHEKGLHNPNRILKGFLLSSCYPSSILKAALMMKRMNSIRDIDMWGEGDRDTEREREKTEAACVFDMSKYLAYLTSKMVKLGS